MDLTPSLSQNSPKRTAEPYMRQRSLPPTGGEDRWGGSTMNPYVERILGLVGDRPVLESLEQTAKRIEAVAGSLGPARLERSYAPGKWTARQILAHLADCELGIGFRLRQALAEENHR